LIRDIFFNFQHQFIDLSNQKSNIFIKPTEFLGGAVESTRDLSPF
jgi:hypothetical protein